MPRRLRQRRVGVRTVLALDVSGSMGGGAVAGVPGPTPWVASAASAGHRRDGAAAQHRRLQAGAGPSMWSAQGIGAAITPVNISPRQRLDDAVRTVAALPMGGGRTAPCRCCGRWAAGWRPILVIWHGTRDLAWPSTRRRLARYRERTGSRLLVVVGMVSNGFSIADPNDGGMLDVVGFDTATSI
ncbi:MAG: hypothetical protein U0531_21195 [Dehalococcoidia bacterium]